MGKILVTLPIDLEDIDLSVMSSQHSDTELIEMICAIDERIADAGFTETIVKSMLASLRGDLSDEGWAALVYDISRITFVSYEDQRKARES